MTGRITTRVEDVNGRVLELLSTCASHISRLTARDSGQQQHSLWFETATAFTFIRSCSDVSSALRQQLHSLPETTAALTP